MIGTRAATSPASGEPSSIGHAACSRLLTSAKCCRLQQPRRRQPGADPQGFIGLEDEVDQHWDRLVMGAMLSTVIGIGAELGSTANDSAIASALRQDSSDSLGQTGQQITQRTLNIQPTFTIRPGFPVRVIINRDLVLAVYQG